MALARQNHLQKNSEWGQTMSGEMGHQLACQEILETGHCSGVSDARMSIPRSDRTNNKSRLSLGRIKKWLTDLEVNCSWRFKELRRQPWNSLYMVIVSLHRGKLEFLEAFWVR